MGRYSVTTFDHRAAWWWNTMREWTSSPESMTRCRCSSHRHFRTRKQALTHAAVLVLRGIVDVWVLGNRCGWLLSTTVPGDGADAAASIAWARRYLALPRRKR